MWLKYIIVTYLNFFIDCNKFVIHSSVFRTNTQRKIEGKITFNYHALEKGLIHEELRHRFGIEKVKRLQYLLSVWIKNKYSLSNSQFVAGCSVLVKYFELHRVNNIEIEDFFPYKEYQLLKNYSKNDIGGVINFNNNEYFKNSASDFLNFSNSRHSVRNFNQEKVSVELIKKAIEITINSPSVCNRQTIKIKLIDDKAIAKQVLSIQQGINSTANTINQILVVVGDLNYFLSAGERNQVFVDGGIILQNLLYALHYYEIAGCPLHWSLPFQHDIRIKNALKLRNSEKVIALVAIGYPNSSFKVPHSCRKNVEEVFQII